MTKNKKRRRNRKATEDAILAAFERVVERDGLRNASPTTVMAEAGYSKPLLYDYFGDMAGLVRAWFDRHHVWPDYNLPVVIEDEDHLKQCLKDFMLKTADALRGNPCFQEILAAELTKNWEYQEILEASREEWFKENLGALMAHPELSKEENWNLLFVIYNSINYLALRSRSPSPHVGLHIDSELGWRDAMNRVESTIDDLILLSKIRELMK
ncbi:MAG: TetR/AcrR family transcriptional regulator [Gammaproteobacteria bacterium]|nr:TetR/AcrR family transcriptional regulator [Gammaproteobacteria bacterium]MBT8443135.1 TetR/AcrR family transcriptional regulator [Gammaproteobacteria bacterium]